MSPAQEIRRPGYLIFRENGTFDSKVMTLLMSTEVITELDEITKIVEKVRPLISASQIAQRNLLALQNFEKEGAKPTPFSVLPSGRMIETSLIYKMDASRHISNFLSSFRSFLDHYSAHLSERFGNHSKEVERFKAETRKHYDSKFGYRFVYRFRNYAQHYSIPISDINVSYLMDHNIQNYALSSRLTLVRNELVRWREWGPLRNEILGLPEKIDIVPLIKEAGNSLNEICIEVLRIDANDLLRCQDYLERVCSILKLEPGAIPVVWIGENAGEGLPPAKMDILPVDEMRLIVRSMGAPV
ncbi:MAG TPA: hypothetical protein VGH02_09630 [Rhizomicrobium sp.]